MKRLIIYMFMLTLPFALVGCPTDDDDDNKTDVDDDDDNDDNDDDIVIDDDDDSDVCNDSQKITGSALSGYPIAGDITITVDDDVYLANGAIKSKKITPGQSGQVNYSIDGIAPGEYYVSAAHLVGNHLGEPAAGDAYVIYPEKVTVCASDIELNFKLKPICIDGLSVSGTVGGAWYTNPITEVIVILTETVPGGDDVITHFISAPDAGGMADYSYDNLAGGLYTVGAVQFHDGVPESPGDKDNLGGFNDQPQFVCTESLTADFAMETPGGDPDPGNGCTYPAVDACPANSNSDINISLTGYNSAGPDVSVMVFNTHPDPSVALNPDYTLTVAPDAGGAAVNTVYSPAGTAVPVFVIAVQWINGSDTLSSGDYLGAKELVDQAGCLERYFPCNGDVNLALDMAQMP